MSQLLQYYKSFQNRRLPAPFTPTFEDLTIDDSLSELQRLVKYAKSAIGLQRLVHVKMLSYIASSQSIDVIISQIVPLLSIYSDDKEPAIRQHLVEQMIEFAKCCNGHGIAGYRILLDNVIPTTAKLLEDTKPEVRHAAVSALVESAKFVHADDLGQHILTIVLKLAHDDDKEEMRMTAAELLNMLAECLGQDLCRQFVIPEVVSLAEDPVFRVRKSTALNFHNICKIGGEHELFERLMPAFVRLSKDDMYRVRRACGESLSEISKYVSDDIRIGVLVEIFLRLAQDASRLVKQSVLQQAGMFISTLPSRVVNDSILGHYCSMINEPTGDMTVDAELKHHCAFSFPAVLQTIGYPRWKEVKDVYNSLVQSRSVSVKQTLASSLHEVARILADGYDLEEELGPIFEEMLQDVEEVQMGVIKNLAVFLSLLPELCRISYLPVLHDILHSTNHFNWRLRQALAQQLPALIDLPAKSDACTMLFPLVMTLLQDPVADVRRDSYSGVSKLLLVLYEQSRLELAMSSQTTSPRGSFVIPSGNSLTDMTPPTEGPSVSTSVNSASDSSQNGQPMNPRKATHDLENVIRAINQLVKGETYQIRQLWLELCDRLLRDLPRELFEKSFIDGILKLTVDRVTNVRIAVAILLGGWESSIQVLDHSGQVDSGHTNEKEMTVESNPIPESSPWSWLLQRPDIRECVKRLSKDDQDIFVRLSKLQSLFPDIVFEKVCCRGLKEPPGGIEPIVYSGVTRELDIVLEIDDDVDDLNRANLLPHVQSLDLSDPSAAHIHYPAGASPRGVGAPNITRAPIPVTFDGISPESELENLEGFEEFMDTMDMGPGHV